MTPSLFEKLVAEIRLALVGAAVRSVHSLASHELAIAFDAEEFRILYLNFDSRDGRLYMIKRRLRDLKKQSIHPTQFAIALQKRIAGTTLTSVGQLHDDRVGELVFSRDESADEAVRHTMMIQLTGRSSNLFLLDGERRIVAAARRPSDESQAIGSIYLPPTRKRGSEGSTESTLRDELDLSGSRSISEALDAFYQMSNSNSEFEMLAAFVRNANVKEIAKRRKLISNLKADLSVHGDAELWKKYGDLLLASSNSAVREGSVIRVADLYQESAPVIEIEVSENDSITEAAEKYFRKYAKARNAQTAIAERSAKVENEITKLEEKRVAIEQAIVSQDMELLQSLSRSKPTARSTKRAEKIQSAYSGVRIFRSSDGFEILVGKKAKDNDQLTFRIARSRDTWMHAADYPGSHVVVRNPGRKELPQRTLIEAAELAAFFSQGKKQPKAAVHYTLKKFVNKPKRAAAGLVSLASFKTLLVEPVINVKMENVTR